MNEDMEQTCENPEQAAKVPENKAQAADGVRSVLESMLFASEKPLTIDEIRSVLNTTDTSAVRQTLSELAAEYEQQNRGLRICEVAGGFRMVTAPQFAPFLRKLLRGNKSGDKLSGPALETLAIIAYKQPLTRSEIETLRRVNVDGVVTTLVEKGLIRVAGRKDVPGKPKVYGTTRLFLEYFGLKTLDELPKLPALPAAPAAETPVEERTVQQGNEHAPVEKSPQ